MTLYRAQLRRGYVWISLLNGTGYLEGIDGLIRAQGSDIARWQISCVMPVNNLRDLA
jgi:hypothetical protein